MDDPSAPLPSSAERTADLLKVVNSIAEWLYPHRSTKQAIVLRAYAYVWYLRPEWLGEPTQAELAKKLGVSKQSFGKVVNELRKKFGFYVAGMRHESAREKFSRNAKAAAPKLATDRKSAFTKGNQ